jgi:hypothetical protein
MVSALCVLTACAGNGAREEMVGSGIQLGVYDSRAVAIAHFGRVIQEGRLEQLYQAHGEAEKEGDVVRAEELAAEAQSLQKQIHIRVFGAAPIDDIIAEVEKDIAAIARAEHLDAVVNKWGLDYRGERVGVVDITKQVVNLFDPSEETLKKANGIMEHDPVSLEDLVEMDHLKS